MNSPRAVQLAALGLSPWWADVLDGHLPPQVVDVQGWWRDRYTGRRVGTVADLRIVALRLRGDTVAQVATRVGVSGQSVRDRWALTAPALVAGSGLDWTYTQPRTGWHRTALARLGLDGPRPPTPPEPPRLPVEAVLDAWRAGQPLDQIAATAGLPGRTQLRRALADQGLTLTPARLTAADVARRYGLSRGHITTLIHAGRLPAPDGTDTGHRWWWQETTDAWAAARGRCPVCGAAVNHLPAHRTVHASSREVNPRG